ncbi:Mu transposase C-terminal domain-containing protein [Rubrimonas sp.]|uniref:Mu transposase C-terminal domain-containing protein n=1 Tax=Rubrimonas sp. TaxID=2036015 RepID=UPI002FDE690A
MNKLHGRTPLQMWAAGVEQSGVTPAPDIVDRRRVFGTDLTRKLQPSGVLVLGVRYHGAELYRPELQKKTGRVELRWHPDNIGAISVRRGMGWLEVGAVMDEFHGRRAEDWLDVVAQLRSDRATTEAANRAVIREAFDSIARTNAAAMQRTNIKLPDWSDRRIASEEQRLFIGFRVAESPAAPAAPVGDGLIAQSFPTGDAPASSPGAGSMPLIDHAPADDDPADDDPADDDHDDDLAAWEIRK